MSSREILSTAFLLLALASCSVVRRAVSVSERAPIALSLPSDEEVEEKMNSMVEKIVTDSSTHDGPFIMNAIRDEQTGEMVATDVIKASKVTARFRHVAERLGKVSLEFDISVPGELAESDWQLRFYPVLSVPGDTVQLEPVFITGNRFREAQLRGYQRYNNYLSSIITDSIEFLWKRQLEIFLSRQHAPELTPDRAREHYTSHFLVRRNDRREANLERIYARYVKTPLVTDGIRLDTVIRDVDGTLVYRYVQEMNTRPGMKKASISIDGSLHDFGRRLCGLPSPEELVFYISSLSTLAESSERYVTRIISRNAYDRTLALVDFAKGSCSIDTSLGCNGSELRRIRKCIDEMFADVEFEVDSLIVTASCSPEGVFSRNAALARQRGKAMAEYLRLTGSVSQTKVIDRSVPENWELLERLISSDSTLTDDRKSQLLDICNRTRVNEDARENLLSRTDSYRYLREKIYPRLRTVQLEFYTHRAGMVKDTIHTTVLDTVYAAGVEAIHQMDYRRAAELLRPYRDYNSALAFASLSYDNTALDILLGLDQSNPKVLYLEAVCLSRLGRRREAIDSYRKSAELDPALVHRANLDPEISNLINNTLL